MTKVYKSYEKTGNSYKALIPFVYGKIEMQKKGSKSA